MEIRTILSEPPSLVWILGDFETLFLYFLVLNMISSLVLSPTAMAVFSNGALVQPQPGFTFRIFRVSSPVEYNQKT